MLRGFRLLGLDDFEVSRRRGAGLLIFASALVLAYWVLWFSDRGVVASDHTSQYISFEQSFPLADAWLLAAMVVAAIQLWRRRPSALAWGFVVGGAGVYLCAMDVLYDLEHGTYTKGQGGTIELAINLATAAMSIGVMSVGWHFRHELLGSSTDR
jgi:ferric-dicitrate binding protein FerR (iron transport regulator)